MLRILIALCLIFYKTALAESYYDAAAKYSNQLQEKVEKFCNKTEMKRFSESLNKGVERYRNITTGNDSLSQKYDSIVRTFESKEFREKVDEATKRIISGWLKYEKGKTLELLNKIRKEQKKNRGRYYLLVFLSRSMGKLFEDYLSDMDIILEKQRKLKLIPAGVLIGVIRDKSGKPSLGATVRWLRKELSKHKSEILIDPTMYRRYGIDRVPCLVIDRYENVEQKVCGDEVYRGCGMPIFGFLEKVADTTNDKRLEKVLEEVLR
ncbi:TrbC family F-type conjugative pilus assembly protein [Desulfurobacterium sp.]